MLHWLWWQDQMGTCCLLLVLPHDPKAWVVLCKHAYMQTTRYKIMGKLTHFFEWTQHLSETSGVSGAPIWQKGLYKYLFCHRYPVATRLEAIALTCPLMPLVFSQFWRTFRQFPFVVHMHLLWICVLTKHLCPPALIAGKVQARLRDLPSA